MHWYVVCQRRPYTMDGGVGQLEVGMWVVIPWDVPYGPGLAAAHRRLPDFSNDQHFHLLSPRRQPVLGRG
jgi:hypothetical protein